MLTRRLWLIAPLALACFQLACELPGNTDPDLDEPDDPVPTTLALISGDGQSTVVATPLAQPLVVEVRDADDKVLPGVAVAWTSSAGSIEATTAVTDSKGRASAAWTLGSAAEAQTATATVESLSPVTFKATGLPGIVEVVSLDADTIQFSAVAQERQLAVLITDQFGNELASDSTIAWKVANLEIATVSATGLLAAKSVGNSLVVVTVGTSADTAVVLVRESVGQAGKQVNAQGGKVQLDVPAGAVTEDVTINVEPVKAGDLPSDGSVLPGTAFHFTPSGLTFAQPVPVAIAYDPAAIPSNKAASRLRLQTLEAGKWVPIAGSFADIANNSVKGELTGFSIKGASFGPGYTQLTTGMYHTCALDENGAAFCWGGNLYGELGDGTMIGRVTPAAVKTSLRFSSISASEMHNCAIDGDGAAYCWGLNQYGALGDGTTSDSPLPTPVAGNLSFTQVSTGWRHTCGITTSGEAYCWGVNREHQLGSPSADTCTMGTTTAQMCNFNPTPVVGGHTFVAISTGLNHTCALTAVGEAYCWGVLDLYSAPIQEPTLVSGELAFKEVHAGVGYTCGLTTGGAAYCWGYEFYGRRGYGTITGPITAEPTPVVGGHTFTSLAVNPDNIIFGGTCGLKADGSVYCWGAGNMGQLGSSATSTTCTLGGNTFPCSGTPVLVAGAPRFVAIRASGVFNCGTTAGGEVWCWGGNDYGQQGNGYLREELEADPLSRVLFPWEPAPATPPAPPATNLSPPTAQLKVVR